MSENPESLIGLLKDKIGGAGFSGTELLPVVQPVFMSEESGDEIYLMQMMPELVDALTEGQQLTARGDAEETAVLCSKSSTFEIKEAETSNGLLLVPDLLFPKKNDTSNSVAEETVHVQQICGVFNSYYELKQIKPKLSKLRQMLQKCPYRGKMYEDEPGEKYTMEDLLSRVQASEDELNTELRKLHACEISGYIRILEFDYKFQVMSQICDTLDSESVPWNKVPKNRIISLLEELEPREILEQCFALYAYETGEEENGEKLYSLKEDEVCRLFGEVLLRPTTMFNLQEFLPSWQLSVPEGMVTNLSQLSGLAFTNMSSKPFVICYLSASELPDNINERFSKLFKKKRKWTYEEIEPYVRDLASGNQDVKALLTKHTRSSISNGVRVFSSKW